jgi:nucleoporin NUP188-like protein
LFVGYPGYNTNTFRLTSPLLYDPTTTIGRSDPLLDGSTNDTLGVPVGTFGTVVSNGSFVFIPPGFDGPPGTREVHTQIISINLQDVFAFGAFVHAGTNAPSQHPSFGQVQSQSPSGNPSIDFPAKSFFDIFVEVELPGLGGTGALISNASPLVVTATNLTMFPPKVIYIHGFTPAVPMYFETSNSNGFWHAGDQLGWLVLAGHGAGFTTNPTDVAQFQFFMQNQPELVVPPNPISGIQLFGPNVAVTDPTVAGEAYQLQYSGSLSPPNWINSGVPTNSAGGPLLFPDFGGALQPQRFYRIMALP